MQYDSVVQLLGNDKYGTHSIRASIVENAAMEENTFSPNCLSNNTSVGHTGRHSKCLHRSRCAT